MQLTVLIDNSPGPGILSEHGLSLHIVAGGTRLLFDMGQSSHFARNAGHLCVDPTEVDLAVISHGHYDHGGGLGCFLDLNDHAPVYLRSGADGLFLAGNREYDYIGLDRDLLEANKERLRWVDEDVEAREGIHLLTSIPCSEPRPRGNMGLVMDRGDELVQDDFSHELFCVIEEDDGITVVTGCGHSGIANMVLAAREHFPGRKIKAVVGGLHLLDDNATGEPVADQEGVEALLRALHGQDGVKIVTGHCTGEGAMSMLEEILGKDMVRMYAGMRMVL